MRFVKQFAVIFSAIVIGFSVSLANADVYSYVASWLNTTTLFKSVAATVNIIGTSSIDGADSNQLCLSSAPACTTNGTRGAYITLSGNEQGDTGSVRIQSGAVNGGLLTLYAPQSGAYVGIGANNSNDWEFISSSSSTILTNAAASGGDIVFARTGTTLRVDSGTAASSCRGNATLNGTTAVTVSTTCATTGMSVILARNAAGTVGNAYYTNIQNGTSFDLKSSNVADTGTIDWWILKEG